MTKKIDQISRMEFYWIVSPRFILHHYLVSPKRKPVTVEAAIPFVVGCHVQNVSSAVAAQQTRSKNFDKIYHSSIQAFNSVFCLRVPW